jgi:hypothetical protein
MRIRNRGQFITTWISEADARELIEISPTQSTQLDLLTAYGVLPRGGIESGAQISRRVFALVLVADLKPVEYKVSRAPYPGTLQFLRQFDRPDIEKKEVPVMARFPGILLFGLGLLFSVSYGRSRNFHL